MKPARVIALAVCLSSLGLADMTRDQKIADFTQLADLYAKLYAPYEWKRDTFKFDLLNIKSWVDQAAATKSDLDFYEVCSRYVSSLNDAHDVFTMPSNFQAYLHFDVDLYDNKPIVEFVDRNVLSASKFPFDVGDELISVDGKSAEDLITQFSPFTEIANTKATRRLAADFMTFRVQAQFPHLADLGDTAQVVIRSANTGALRTFTINWDKRFLPITSVGPVPSPKSAAPAAADRLGDDQTGEPDYLAALRPLQNASLPNHFKSTVPFTGKFPIFDPPDTFQLRLGLRSTDVFLSGTYTASGSTIGYIRIPDYAPPSTATAVAQFAAEIAFFQKNTDGLIVDDMRNPGGNACYVETLLTYLIPYQFRAMGYEIRATTIYLNDFNVAFQLSKEQGAPQWVVNLYAAYQAEIQQAFNENRGRTGPLPLCGPSLTLNPATDRAGAQVAYTKPVMVLTDEFSASAGDAFAALFQDAQRGPIFGWRTTGAGGTVIDFDGTNFSEGSTRVTVSLMHRKTDIVTSDFPTAPYVENIGVRPDIEEDYMTMDNLLNNGAPFVQSFTSSMVNLISKTKKEASQTKYRLK
jgi:hypothetical protein